jgi:hypothetical protein
MSPKHYLLAIIQSIWILTVCEGKSCVTDGPCSCTYDDGSGTVDISSLGNTDGTPRYALFSVEDTSLSQQLIVQAGPCLGGCKGGCLRCHKRVFHADLKNPLGF